MDKGSRPDHQEISVSPRRAVLSAGHPTKRVTHGIAAALAMLALLTSTEEVPAQALRGEGRRSFGDSTATIHSARDRSLDVKHMVLNLSFDWDRRWAGGETTLTLTPLAVPRPTVALAAAQVKATKAAAGETAPYE